MITQCRFSRKLKLFQNNFCEKWGLTSYMDINDSCFFVGVYRQEDVDVINDHKGFKVVWLTSNIRGAFWNINPSDVIVRLSSLDSAAYQAIEKKYKCKYVNFPIKDFSMFEPNILKDSIYVYLGNRKAKYVYGYDIIKKIEKRVPYRMLYGMHPIPNKPNSIIFMKNEYYDKCFVNIKINIYKGFTTATELAFMGRKTISNADAPFCIGYKDEDDIVDLINKEAEKIGTIQESQIGDWFDTGDEWKNENFWL